jgi:ubiquinone biosynthesis monooxygenase Coq7
MFMRRLSVIDRFLEEADRALSTTLGAAQAAERTSPAQGIAEGELEESQRRHAAGLMRVNHTGEVCAQALYSGQAAVARDEATRAQLLKAAQEETDHLVWCADSDAASRAVVAQMQLDEARHGELAKRAGGIELPPPIPTLMKFASTLMKTVAYRI